MDLIVAACRTLASRPRLRLLHAIYAAPAITVRDLANAVAQPPAATSHQLKLLGDFHFIQAVPSGRYVHCHPAVAGATAHPFLQGLQDMMHEVWAAQEPNRIPVQVCDSAPASSWETVYDALEKLFTTYTHLRRLLIVRQLARQGECTAVDLMEAVGMSSDATHRHLAKLQRRGVVASIATVPGKWCLVPHKGDACRQQLLGLVLRELKAE